MDVVIFKLLKKRVNFQDGAVSHTVENGSKENPQFGGRWRAQH